MAAPCAVEIPDSDGGGSTTARSVCLWRTKATILPDPADAAGEVNAQNSGRWLTPLFDDKQHVAITTGDNAPWQKPGPWL